MMFNVDVQTVRNINERVDFPHVFGWYDCLHFITPLSAHDPSDVYK